MVHIHNDKKGTDLLNIKSPKILRGLLLYKGQIPFNGLI